MGASQWQRYPLYMTFEMAKKHYDTFSSFIKLFQFWQQNNNSDCDRAFSIIKKFILNSDQNCSMIYCVPCYRKCNQISSCFIYVPCGTVNSKILFFYINKCETMNIAHIQKNLHLCHMFSQAFWHVLTCHVMTWFLIFRG